MSIRIRVFTLAAAALLTACGGTTSTAPAGSAKVSPPPDGELYTAGTLTIGSDVSYPPQEYFPEGSQTATGFDVDLGKALADKMGLKFAVVNQVFAGIIPGLSGKKFDVIISAMTINADRQKVVDFIPYFNAGESFVVAQNATKLPTKLADLCGLTVAVEAATAELDEANGLNKSGAICASNHIKLQTFQIDTDALAQLKKGAVDVHFTDSPVAGYEISHQSGLKISGGVIEVAPEGIAVRKGDAAIEDPLKAAFTALEDDGTYDRLLTKWGLKDGDVRKPIPSAT